MIKRATGGRRNLKPVPANLSATKKEAQIPKSVVPKPIEPPHVTTTDPTVSKSPAMQPQVKKGPAVPKAEVSTGETYNLQLSIRPSVNMLVKAEKIAEAYGQPVGEIFRALLKKAHETFRTKSADGTLKELKPIIGEIDGNIEAIAGRNSNITDAEIEAAQFVVDPLKIQTHRKCLSEIYLRIIQCELGIE